MGTLSIGWLTLVFVFLASFLATVTVSAISLYPPLKEVLVRKGWHTRPIIALSVAIAFISALSLWMTADPFPASTASSMARVHSVRDSAVGLYVIEGDNAANFKPGTDLVVYANLPVPGQANTLRDVVGVLRVVGGVNGQPLAQAILTQDGHPLAPGLMVDEHTENLNGSSLVPADPEAVGYLLEANKVFLRPNVSITVGSNLEAITPVINRNVIVDYLASEPKTDFEVSALGQNQRVAEVKLISGTWPSPGTLMRLHQAITMTSASDNECGGALINFDTNAGQFDFDPAFGFSRYSLKVLDGRPANGLLNSSIRSVEVDNSGVWVGYVRSATLPDGVSRFFRGDSGFAQNWETCSWQNKSIGHHINSISRAPDGALWVITDGDGAWILRNKVWQQFTPGNSSFPSQSAYTITYRDNQPIVGTLNGLAAYADGLWQQIAIPGAQDDDDRRVHAIAFAPDRTMWIGRIARGVVRVDSSGRSQIYRAAAGVLTSDNIRSILIDDFGRTWVATAGGGIDVYDGQQWMSFTAANSDLPSDQVSNLVKDRFGRIWAATDAGAAYFTGQKWVPYSSLHTYAIAFGTGDCPTCQFNADNVWTATTDGLTHSRLPAISPVVTAYTVQGIPDTLQPGQKFTPQISLELEPGIQLAAGDLLRNQTDEQSAVPQLAFPGAVTVTGNRYVFDFAHSPLTAPQKTGDFVSRWRLWQRGRYVGPSIELHLKIAAP